MVEVGATQTIPLCARQGHCEDVRTDVEIRLVKHDAGTLAAELELLGDDLAISTPTFGPRVNPTACTPGPETN
ncbi:hypothetical protein J2X01_002550 [Arthrobacter ginsengisoli]|uniref:Uncharacterized protein n=1 Tax=Arthrobacter ginsengisoli TaxID=1356565 RepID=A0ABU1UDK7_9MICC|nr:hypothetical protein [Arthrobacter ginsengisoli]MDR7083256.1 hypothetical protein [Arthrobacter ginsengisoli]